MPLGRVQHGSKNAYSLDLRRKFLEAKERGMSTLEDIHNFRVVLSWVKRYAKTGVKGDDCARRRYPASRPKAEERARRLLETDLHECPAVTLSERREFLERLAGAGELATASRLLRHLRVDPKMVGGRQ